MSYLDHLISQMQQKQYLYLFEHKVRIGWFMIDYDSIEQNNSLVVWFPNKSLAVKFLSEESVEEFKYNFLSQRPVSIVKVKITEQNMQEFLQ